MKRTLLVLILSAGALTAQFAPPPQAAGGTQPVQLPLSGRPGNAGAVTATQTPVAGTTSSVNTINSGLQVTGPYSGSQPVGAPPFQGRLSLTEAVQRALAANLGAVNANITLRQSKA